MVGAGIVRSLKPIIPAHTLTSDSNNRIMYGAPGLDFPVIGPCYSVPFITAFHVMYPVVPTAVPLATSAMLQQFAGIKIRIANGQLRWSRYGMSRQKSPRIPESRRNPENDKQGNTGQFTLLLLLSVSCRFLELQFWRGCEG